MSQKKKNLQKNLE
jgi:hypothetical protein